MAASFSSPRDPAREADHPLARAFASFAPPESPHLGHKFAISPEYAEPEFPDPSFQFSAKAQHGERAS